MKVECKEIEVREVEEPKPGDLYYCITRNANRCYGEYFVLTKCYLGNKKYYHFVNLSNPTPDCQLCESIEELLKQYNYLTPFYGTVQLSSIMQYDL